MFYLHNSYTCKQRPKYIAHSDTFVICTYYLMSRMVGWPRIYSVTLRSLIFHCDWKRCVVVDVFILDVYTYTRYHLLCRYIASTRTHTHTQKSTACIIEFSHIPTSVARQLRIRAMWVISASISLCTCVSIAKRCEKRGECSRLVQYNIQHPSPNHTHTHVARIKLYSDVIVVM